MPKKGLDLFLGAADPAFELVAVTDRPPGDGAGGTILPFMGHERLQELLDCVDAFVLPSEAEGFPLALQEALVKGLPIVTAWQPGTSATSRLRTPSSSSATPTRSARLCSGSSETTSFAPSLSERARAAAERSFGVERFVDAYEDAYTEARDLAAARR